VPEKKPRVVIDTNVVAFGALWKGKPFQLLGFGIAGKLILFTSSELLDELLNVLQRDKFSEGLKLIVRSARQVVNDYTDICEIVKPESVQQVVLDDPNDDKVIACAVAAKANFIVTGDKHLLKLKRHGDIEILTVAKMIERLEADDSKTEEDKSE
jgi:putative PIN family toxin of toxin-antitoxin system